MKELRSALILILLLLQNHACSSLTSPTSTKSTHGAILVRMASSAPRDIQALADLRFDEWICGVYNDTSREAFRYATAYLYYERAALGTKVFLACQYQPNYDSDEDSEKILGAGEIGPIELQGAWHDKSMTTSTALYVTDLVTARAHRRKGVAKSIMMAMEDYAQNSFGVSTFLLLHVTSDNEKALAFYTNMGYATSLSSELAQSLDLQKLDENAGTMGQILLWKRLNPKHKQTSRKRKKTKDGRRQGGLGFG